jgi:aminocarboxymuconate-semialdehyde decarboxylase
MSSIGVFDIHAHFWPRGLLAAIREGGSWYGWRAEHTPDGLRVVINGRTLPFAVPSVDLDEPVERMQLRMDRDGVSTEALMPAGFFWGDHLGERDAVRFCREINDEAIQLQRAYPSRFVALAILPLRYPLAARHEVHRILSDLGSRGFALPTNVAGVDLDHASLRGVLDEIGSARAPVVIHPNFLSFIGADRLSRYRLQTSIGNPTELAMAAASLILGGYFDRNPGSQAAFCQGGGSIPSLLGRLDLQYRQSAEGRGEASRTPSAYLDRMYFDSLTQDGDSFRSLINRAGADRLMVGTDYPFLVVPRPDSNAAGSVGTFLQSDEQARVFFENALGFFGRASPPTALG